MPRCPNCRHLVASDAVTCPSCGKKKPGQSILGVIFVIIIILIILGANR